MDYDFPDFLRFAVSAKDVITSLLQSLPENRLGFHSFMPIKEHGFFTLSWGGVEDRRFSVPKEDIPNYDPKNPGLNFTMVPEDDTKYGIVDEVTDKKHFLKF